jgi:hypothetical protein
MVSRLHRVVACAALFALFGSASVGTQEQKPLVNADVVTMVKSGLPERTIIRSVQTNATQFDVTPEGLIALHEAGVSQKVMDAMLAASKKRAAPARAGAGTRTSGRASGRGTGLVMPRASRGLPLVVFLNGDARQDVPVERTSLAQSKAKPSSLGALAKEKAIDQVVKAGVQATRDVGGRTVGRAVGQATKGAAGLLTGDGSDKTITYVWMLPGLTSETVTRTTADFELSLNNAAGLKPEEFAPVVIKLTPSVTGYRLVGATEGKVETRANTALDWPLYAGFVEDRVPASVTSISPGVWKISVTSPLQPGDYAVVLRPTSKDKRFAGADVARNQGEGIAFNSAWPFAVK